MTRYLRLVAYGDDGAELPPLGSVPRRRRPERAAEYQAIYDDLRRRGYHPAVAAIDAEQILERRYRRVTRPDRRHQS